MSSRKVTLSGSECKPIGTRVGDQPGDETVDVSIILKPKARAVMPQSGGATTTRAEFAKAYGADTAAIAKVRQFAKEYGLTVVEKSVPRRTVRLEGTAANMMKAFEVKLERYEDQGQPYRFCSGSIKLPAELAPSVEAVLGLDNRPQAKAHFRVLGETPGSGRRPPRFPTHLARLRSFISSRSMWMARVRLWALSNWAGDTRQPT